MPGRIASAIFGVMRSSREIDKATKPAPPASPPIPSNPSSKRRRCTASSRRELKAGKARNDATQPGAEPDGQGVVYPKDRIGPYSYRLPISIEDDPDPDVF